MGLFHTQVSELSQSFYEIRHVLVIELIEIHFFVILLLRLYDTLGLFR